MGDLSFPLVLSCGHLASDALVPGGCGCQHKYAYSGSSDDGPIGEAFRRFNGIWRQTIEGYGAQLPRSRKHGPCPVCGGKDRFRFDDKEGKGTWICNQCGAGNGLQLLSLYIGKSMKETAVELVGENHVKTSAPARNFAAIDEKKRQEGFVVAARAARLMIEKSKKAEHPYMADKGLGGEWLVNSEIMMGRNGEPVQSGDLMLVPIFKNGELINAQSIKCLPDGKSEKRFIGGGEMAGGCHSIPGDKKFVAVVEGFATGVTVSRMTGAQVYVAFMTSNLAEVVRQAKEANPGKSVTIFADNDPFDDFHKWHPGLHFAEQAAAPYGARIALPPEEGDWDDYRQRHGDDDCRRAMREAVSLDGKLPENKKPPFEGLVEEKAEQPPVEVKGEQLAPLTFGLYLPGSAPSPAPPVQSVTDEEYSHPGEIPKGISLKNVDVDHPPGLTGRIVDYIRAGAHRELTGGAYSVMALQCIAIAASGLKTYGGGKTSLITIILALSGAGKERGQSVIKDILTEAGRKVYGDIRSDKDVIMTTMYDAGRSAYIVDEAHKFLVQPKGGSSYAANISTTLMELATTDNFKPARNHVSEVETTIRNSLSRLEKEKLALEEAMGRCNQEHEKDKIKMYEAMLSKKMLKISMEESALHMMETGIPNPCLNLAGSSTPGKLSAMVSTDNIDSGLLARAIVVDCGESRARKNRAMVGVDASQLNAIDRMNIIRDISLIAGDADYAMKSVAEKEFEDQSREILTVTATDEAIEMINLIDMHYDQDRYRNHDQIGSMYARISERVQMLSSLMAFGNVQGDKAVIEPEFVTWSLALIIKSFDNLISNLKLNAAVDGDDISDKVAAIQEKIIRRLQNGKGETIYMAAIKQTITKASYYKEIKKALENTGQDAFQNAIMALQLSGKIVVEGKSVRLA